MSPTSKSLGLKILKSILFILLFVGCWKFTLSLPNGLAVGEARAQNKCGVNIGPNYNQVFQAASLTKHGGWIVSLGNLGNSNNFSSLFGKNINVVLRAYNGGKPFDDDQALAWTATLGKMDSKNQKIFFMPWNEPNHENEGGGASSGNLAYQYIQSLVKYLSSSGLRNTKVNLLSPMIDKLNPSFINGSFFTNPGGKSGFYQLSSASAINEYDQFSPGPCSSMKEQNNCLYDQIGIPGPYYALESGVAGTCTPPCYNDSDLRKMLSAVWPKWKNDNNFKMFAIFSYDPHRTDWNIFSAPEIKNFYSQNCSPGAIESGSFDQNKFNQWFETIKDKLVACSGGGYAPKNRPELCEGTGSSDIENGRLFTPARVVETSDVAESISDTVLLDQNASLNSPNAGPRDITRGGFFEQFQDLSIPFAKELTRYLAGPFVREVGSNSNLEIKRFNTSPSPDTAGVLAKLYPEAAQDYLRHLYRWKCGNSYGDGNGYYCSNRTIGIAPDCPSSESNECLFSDGTEIADGPRKPWPEDPKYKQDLDAWNLPSNQKSRDLWHEIPLVSNPKTFVDQAINIQACPAGSSSTTTSIRVPWVSALKDVAKNLNDLLLPKSAGQALLPQEKQNTLLASNTLVSPKNLMGAVQPIRLDNAPNLLAQTAPPNTCPVSVNTAGGGNYQIYPNLGDNDCYWRDPQGTYSCDGASNPLDSNRFRQLAFNAPIEFQCPPNTKNVVVYISSAGRMGPEKCDWIPQNNFGCACSVSTNASGQITTSCAPSGQTAPPPVCVPPGTPNYISDPDGDPVNASGHTLFRDWPKTTTLTCKKWVGSICVDGESEFDISDPVWAVVKYPFLNTIYNYLSGDNGIFRLFKPSQEDVKDWADAGESKIAYCVMKDHRASSMLEPALAIDKIPFVTPPARCEDNPATYTKNLSVYPEFIGGVENAKNWVVKCLLNPNSSCRSQSSSTPIPNYNKTAAVCRELCAPYANNKSSNPIYGTSACPILDYNIDFKNTGIGIADKARLISNVKSRFPKSLIDTKLDYVINESIKNNWSPAFVVALWLEESGASHMVESGASLDALGCIPLDKKNLTESLVCFFKNFKNETDFKSFMLRYSSLDDRDLCGCFCLNPNFPKGIKREYQLVSQIQL